MDYALETLTESIRVELIRVHYAEEALKKPIATLDKRTREAFKETKSISESRIKDLTLAIAKLKK